MALGNEKAIVTVEASLDDTIKGKLRNLPIGKAIAFGWQPSVETVNAIKPLREKFDAYMMALKLHRDKGKDAKGKPVNLTDAQQVALANGAQTVADSAQALIAKGMNAEGTRLRGMLKAFEKSTPDRSYTLSVRTAAKLEDCAFIFRANHVASFTDAADSVLEGLDL